MIKWLLLISVLLIVLLFLRINNNDSELVSIIKDLISNDSYPFNNASPSVYAGLKAINDGVNFSSFFTDEQLRVIRLINASLSINESINTTELLLSIPLINSDLVSTRLSQNPNDYSFITNKPFIFDSLSERLFNGWVVFIISSNDLLINDSGLLVKQFTNNGYLFSVVSNNDYYLNESVNSFRSVT